VDTLRPITAKVKLAWRTARRRFLRVSGHDDVLETQSLAVFWKHFIEIVASRGPVQYFLFLSTFPFGCRSEHTPRELLGSSDPFALANSEP
jgi:hypothetical protein